MLQPKHKARATRQAATICNNYISPQIFSQSPPIRSFSLPHCSSSSICSSYLLNASTFNTPISMSSETGCIYSFFFIIVLFIISSSTALRLSYCCRLSRAFGQLLCENLENAVFPQPKRCHFRGTTLDLLLPAFSNFWSIT